MNDKVIVVGVDTSPRAALVLDAARTFADRLGAKVVLVSAIEGLELAAMVPPELAAWNNTTLWIELEKQTRAAMKAAAERFAAGTVIEQSVQENQPWRAITETAKKHHAALIVIGAHTYRPIERLLGTTASKVSNRAECSVLIVRQGVGFQRVAVGLDGSERAPPVLAAAQALVGERLTLVRAIQPPQEVSSEIWGKRPDEIMALLTQNAKNALEKIRGGLPDRIAAESVAKIGAPADVVLEVAQAKNAELLVIGSHGYDALDRVLGTTAGRVANQADRSVLIVKNAL
jgi:nucleotide-binding universal stress UspA family protein